ncbi:MAG: hypothetical protein Q9170_005618 [Blastenia crenularia]
MVPFHDHTLIKSLLALATVLVYVSAQTAIRSVKIPSTSSLPAQSICPATSVNHIVQTLPQQCLTTAWPGKAEGVTWPDTQALQVEPTHAEPGSKAVKPTALSEAKTISPPETVSDQASQQPFDTPRSIASSKTAAIDEPATGNGGDVSDGDSDSPFDSANFLSFEGWKKQNLAKAGQSADNLGAGRSGASDPRRRPGGINNALDSLGEDTEIEIDFGGFVNPRVTAPGLHNMVQASEQNGRSTPDVDDMKAKQQPSKAHARSKDAGVTCKERSNYASFDCAATVLKTNSECKSATSVLVENKDSYMLNECSADNKFFIVELCDDILVDTVVLANFEFFSSIFRTFRVSVSDRYPVKLDKWRALGTFEARNNRGIQAFLVEEPQIWARYLRIEFLTHYSHEYYCPVSLLRVHGTTMMEEFNHELKNSKGDDEADDEEQPEEPRSVHEIITADVLKNEIKTSVQQPTSTASSPADDSTSTGTKQSNESVPSRPSDRPKIFTPQDNTTSWGNRPLAQAAAVFASGYLSAQTCSPSDAPVESPTLNSAHTTSNGANKAESSLSWTTGARPIQTISVTTPSTSASSQVPVAAESASASPDTLYSAINGNPSASSKPSSSSPHPASKPHPSSTHPSPPNPTTQESFFKSVHKRLQLLESNSTLSLQYIEEQSRILRDAFAKVEKRQLAKTNTFLELLNTTLLNEVRGFRTQYDQIWQSTVLELSSQRQQSQHEIAALSTRLTLLADELLFQKRIAILQFLLILLCLGLALFSRGSMGVDYLEHVVNKSSLNLSRYAGSHHLDSASPVGSPDSTRPSSRYGFFGRVSGERRRRRESEESALGEGGREGTKSPSIEYEPPTPESLSGESAEGREPESLSGVEGLLTPDDRMDDSSSGGLTPVSGSGKGSS